FFFLNDTATTEIYPLPLHDALPISAPRGPRRKRSAPIPWRRSIRPWSTQRVRRIRTATEASWAILPLRVEVVALCLGRRCSERLRVAIVLCGVVSSLRGGDPCDI